MDKYKKLLEIIRPLSEVAVAFSGGVDSSLLLKASIDALGNDKVIALTVYGNFFPEHETSFAQAFAKEQGVKQKMLPLSLMDIEGFQENSNQRCYFCKLALMGKLIRNTQGKTLLDGSNTDDDKDYRPGSRAIKELDILSPLKEAGLSKDDIRGISKEIGLSTWNMPSCACLASRIPYGQIIDVSTLKTVDKAEDLIRDLGFKQVRVRVHTDDDGRLIGSIEVEKNEIERLRLAEVEAQLKNLGLDEVFIDPSGYESGKLKPILEHI